MVGGMTDTGSGGVGGEHARTVPRKPSAPHGLAADGVTFALCGYVLFALFMGTNVPSPLYRVYQQVFGFSPLVVTLVFAVYMAALIPSLLLFGPLSDVVGRRRVLLAGVGLAISGAALFAVAEGTPWLFAARIVQGVSMGVASGAVTAAMVESEPGRDRARAVVVATGCIVAGGGFGPLLAGLLAQYAPWPRTLVYLVVIAAFLPALYGVTRLPAQASVAAWRPRRPHVPTSILDAFVTASVSSFLAWSVTGLFLSLVPSYAMELAGTENLAVAGGVVAMLLGCSAVAQVRGRGQEPRRAQRRGLGLLVVGLAVLVVAGEARSLTFLAVATVAAGVGQGLAFLGAMAEVNAAAPPEQHADIVSSFYVVTYVGTGAPVIGVGLLATHITLLAAVELFAAALAVICLLASLRLVRPRATGARSSAARAAPSVQ